MTVDQYLSPQLSVVIPAYNSARYIEECLASVFEQEDCPPFEVVVTNDGSTDGTGDLLSRIADHEPRLRVITSSNCGPGHARNLAVESAVGEIIILLDSDDKMLPGRLNHQGRFMLNFPEAGVTFGDALVQNSASSALYIWNLPQLESVEFQEVQRPINRLLADGCFLTTSASAVRRSDYLEVGKQAIDLRVAEDMDFWCRLASAQKRFFVSRF